MCLQMMYLHMNVTRAIKASDGTPFNRVISVRQLQLYKGATEAKLNIKLD